jgi:hypothetical protein
MRARPQPSAQLARAIRPTALSRGRRSSVGYAVTQFYHGLPHPDCASYIGGTRDNG